MGNILFRSADYTGDGQNTIIDNLIGSSNNIGCFPSKMSEILQEPILCYNEYQYPVRNKFQLDNLATDNEEELLKFCKSNLYDFEREDLTSSNFDHIFPLYVSSSVLKQFDSKSYYCKNTQDNWFKLYSLLTQRRSGWTENFTYSTNLTKIDSTINNLRKEKIVLKTENYIKELVEYYMQDGCKHTVDYYIKFFVNKPIKLLELCNKNKIDHVVENYIDLIIESCNQFSTGKRTEKDWIIDIDFHKLLDIDFPESVEYYQDTCDKLGIYSNFEYYEQLHQTVNGKQFDVFVDNIVLQEVLDYYCENNK